MARIWLNHWFSAAYNIINLIHKDNPGFTVIGSSEKLQSPIKAVCGEWYNEPALKGEEYIDFCLDFCRRHSIDVFMPRKEMVSVSKYKDRFAAAGVKVMTDDYKYVSILNRKDKTYEALRDKAAGGVLHLPDYFIAADKEQFEEAYNSLIEKYKYVCFKFVNDEGGKSYRLIDNAKKGYASLFKKQTTRISFDEAITALSERESFTPTMVMPFLPDEEISVDCLKTAKGLIAIPRVKDYTRIEKISYDEKILDACGLIFEVFPLEQPCNIQFKYLNGTPYLLEINTRMSGGVQMSCAASDVNIPSIAVNKLLGIDLDWENIRAERYVTHVEIPVVL